MIQKLYDFRQMELPAALLQAEVTREEMDGELQSVAARFTTIVTVDSPIQNGDVVTLRFADDKAENGIRRLYANVGKGFTDEEELLPGHRVGETLQMSYAGKEVQASIECVKRPQVPALTDAHVQQLGIAQVGDLAAFEEYVFAKLAEGQRKRKFRGIMGLVSKAMLEKTEFAPMADDHPWFQALHRHMMGRVEAFAAENGLTVEQALPEALRMNDQPLEACRQALKAMCVERARTGALGQAYAQENGVTFENENTTDLVGAYADYLNEVVYQHFAPMIQVARQ